LASALEKISKAYTPLKTANVNTAHLFINNPFKNAKVSSLLSTHPPIEKRISLLRNTIRKSIKK